MKHIFKKGQIVPKRLGLINIHSKARHNVRFACDVVVEGREIRALSEGYIIEIRDFGRRLGRGEGSYKKEDTIVSNIYLKGISPQKTPAAFNCIPRQNKYVKPFIVLVNTNLILNG